jgi:hypothetical protein
LNSIKILEIVIKSYSQKEKETMDIHMQRQRHESTQTLPPESTDEIMIKQIQAGHQAAKGK